MKPQTTCSRARCPPERPLAAMAASGARRGSSRKASARRVRSAMALPPRAEGVGGGDREEGGEEDEGRGVQRGGGEEGGAGRFDRGEEDGGDEGGGDGGEPADDDDLEALDRGDDAVGREDEEDRGEQRA